MQSKQEVTRGIVGRDGRQLSPTRRRPTRPFDYRELEADERFCAVLEEHRRNGFFVNIPEGTSEYKRRMDFMSLSYSRSLNEKRAGLFRRQGGLADVRIHQQRKTLEFRMGRYREAISCFDRALEISLNIPNKHLTLANRAAANIRSSRLPEALADAEEAAAVHPGYATAHALVGYCKSRMGQCEEAVLSFKRSLEINPDDQITRRLMEETWQTISHASEQIMTVPQETKRADQGMGKKWIQRKRSGQSRFPRYLDGGARSASLHGPEAKPFASNGTEELVAGELLSLGAQRSLNDGSTPRKWRRSKSTGGQAFASLVKLPGKIKVAITGRSRESSSSNLKASLSGDAQMERVDSGVSGEYDNAARAVDPLDAFLAEVAGDLHSATTPIPRQPPQLDRLVVAGDNPRKPMPAHLASPAPIPAKDNYQGKEKAIEKTMEQYLALETWRRWGYGEVSPGSPRAGVRDVVHQPHASRDGTEGHHGVRVAGRRGGELTLRHETPPGGASFVGEDETTPWDTRPRSGDFNYARITGSGPGPGPGPGPVPISVPVPGSSLSPRMTPMAEKDSTQGMPGQRLSYGGCLEGSPPGRHRREEQAPGSSDTVPYNDERLFPPPPSPRTTPPPPPLHLLRSNESLGVPVPASLQSIVEQRKLRGYRGNADQTPERAPYLRPEGLGNARVSQKARECHAMSQDSPPPQLGPAIYRGPFDEAQVSRAEEQEHTRSVMESPNSRNAREETGNMLLVSKLEGSSQSVHTRRDSDFIMFWNSFGGSDFQDTSKRDWQMGTRPQGMISRSVLDVAAAQFYQSGCPGRKHQHDIEDMIAQEEFPLGAHETVSGSVVTGVDFQPNETLDGGIARLGSNVPRKRRAISPPSWILTWSGVNLGRSMTQLWDKTPRCDAGDVEPGAGQLEVLVTGSTASKIDNVAVGRAKAWIEALTMERCGSDTRLLEWLRDGTILLTLTNVLKPGVTQPEITQPEIAQPEIAQPEIAQPEIAQPEIAQSDGMEWGARGENDALGDPRVTENLQSFFRACEVIGVPKEDLFNPQDLWHEAGLERVVRCIEKLEVAAQGAAPWCLGPTFLPLSGSE